MADWHVYLVRCGDRSLYTGIATDVSRRLAEHRAGGNRAARYLRGRGPLELVFSSRVGSRTMALRVEKLIKKLAKADKETLIAHAHLVGALIAEAGRDGGTAGNIHE
ncbi:MAG: GIY-YIG nuclease family protein [Acidobacteriota bacterium]